MGCRRCAEHLRQPSFYVRLCKLISPVLRGPSGFSGKARFSMGDRFPSYSPWVRSWASGSPSGRRPLSCNPSGKVPLSTLHPPPCSLIKCGNPGSRFPFRPSWKAESGAFQVLFLTAPQPPERRAQQKAQNQSRIPPASSPVTLPAQNSKKPLLPQGQKGLK